MHIRIIAFEFASAISRGKRERKHKMMDKCVRV